MKQTQSDAPTVYTRGATLNSTMFYMGSLMSFLARGDETGGRLSLNEYQSRPGTEPPPHVHEWEHEVYYLLEGQMQFYCQGQVLLVQAGEIIFLPRGHVHAFYIRSPYVRALLLAIAAGEQSVELDQYFTNMATPATSMSLPDEALTYAVVDPSHAIALGLTHGIRILSPEDTLRELPHYPGFGVSPE